MQIIYSKILSSYSYQSESDLQAGNSSAFFNAAEEIRRFEVGYNHESASVTSNFPVTTIPAIYKIMSNLTDLLILYFDSDQKITQLLPSVKPKDLSKLSEKKQKNKLKSASLFKLVYMEIHC
jgi:hypothetical protein